MKETDDSNAVWKLFLESLDPKVLEMDCDYIRDGRKSRILLLSNAERLKESYHLYLKKGFRRFGEYLYQNICENCSECISIRLETDRFVLSKSQKRCLKKNSDVEVIISQDSVLDAEKLALYTRYREARHPDGQQNDYANEIGNCHSGYSGTIEIQYRLEGRLIGVSIIDMALDSVSAVYFYYDPDLMQRRLGIFSMIQEILLARKLGKKYYYLGYYIESVECMAYKKYFRPNQLEKDGVWKDFLSK